jgi:hypothetical protein
MGSPAAESEDWADIAYAAEQTGFSSVLILGLIESGDMPAMQVKASKRTAHRIPRRLVDEARDTVMAGGQVELREFARQWSARNATNRAAA